MAAPATELRTESSGARSRGRKPPRWTRSFFFFVMGVLPETTRIVLESFFKRFRSETVNLMFPSSKFIQHSVRANISSFVANFKIAFLCLMLQVLRYFKKFTLPFIFFDEFMFSTFYVFISEEI